MKRKCKKCKTDCQEPGKYFTEACETFYLCKFCSEILENLPTGNTLHYFLRSDGHELVKNPINRNILLARMRRANNQSIWL